MRHAPVSPWLLSGGGLAAAAAFLEQSMLLNADEVCACDFSAGRGDIALWQPPQAAAIAATPLAAASSDAASPARRAASCIVPR